jgi:hypothetical protein
MYPHDVAEVLKIRIPQRGGEDFVAWHYEKSGLFSVRSAYKLALDSEMAERAHERSSSRPSGDRSMFKEIWSAKVPPKVRVFAWRLAQEGIATDSNRKKEH